MKIVNAEQMRAIDRRATERFGIPSLMLMENAAIAVTDALLQHFPEAERAAIFCGVGQNGGDGFAIARHLESRGVVPVVLLIGDRLRITGDAATNLTICERLGFPLYEVTDDESLSEALLHAADVDVIVDALFGTGLNRAPGGIEAEAIHSINEMAAPVIAVDLPSGANASSGTPFEPCVQATVTVTFAAPKLAHIFEPSAGFCGEVIVAPISIPHAAIEDEGVTLALNAPEDVLPFLQPRASNSHKGTYGHVGILAGSPGRSGAAVLCARGAIRAGAGLVTVCTDRDTAIIVTGASCEAMTFTGSAEAMLETLQKKSAVVAGPGLPDSEPAYQQIRRILDAIDVPLVLDASALNAYAGRAAEINPKKRVRVITPHPGELARLMATTTAAIQADRVESARNAARQCQCIVVLKGHQTLIADPDGHVRVNPTGNPGMATGGMGDVLAGILAALLARGVDPFDAACTAVYLHGFAGDLLEEQMGDTGLAAMDLAERLPEAMRKLRG